jgi:hypothetical protein
MTLWLASRDTRQTCERMADPGDPALKMLETRIHLANGYSAVLKTSNSCSQLVSGFHLGKIRSPTSKSLIQKPDFAYRILVGTVTAPLSWRANQPGVSGQVPGSGRCALRTPDSEMRPPCGGSPSGEMAGCYGTDSPFTNAATSLCTSVACVMNR